MCNCQYHCCIGCEQGRWKKDVVPVGLWMISSGIFSAFINLPLRNFFLSSLHGFQFYTKLSLEDFKGNNENVNLPEKINTLSDFTKLEVI
jgi:hypothetical protein